MQAFQRGQKARLSDLGVAARLRVAIAWPAARGVDVSCFGLDAGDRLADDRYMVFYNQVASAQDEIALRLEAGGAVFRIDLDALPASVAKLVFTAAPDGDGAMRAVERIGMRLDDAVELSLAGSDFGAEKAVILGELYRKDGQWRFGAVGQGFDGGMAALLRHFGGEEAAARPAPVPVSPPAQAPALPAPAPAAKISLSKITLDKRGDKISLDKKHADGFGRIHMNLNWNRRPGGEPGRGLFGKLLGGASKGIDLDLGCLYELADGGKGVVQALGKSWGRFDAAPYVELEGDDRTGDQAGGENMVVNGDRFDRIRRILVFAFIYEGVANWAQTDGVVTVRIPDQPVLEIRLDHGKPQAMCAIAMIENDGGRIKVTKLVEYVREHRELDRRYGFGLHWKTGSKD